MSKFRATPAFASRLVGALCLLGLAGAGSAHAVTFTLEDVSYNWTGTTGGTGVVEQHDVGANHREEVRWGIPLAGDPGDVNLKSGLGIEKSFGIFGSLPFSVTENQSFPLGLFTHFNFEIVLGSEATSAFLDVTPTITVNGTDVAAGTFSFRFDIEETPNALSLGSCPSFQQSTTPCDDRITPFTAVPQSFVVDGQGYTISIVGFCLTCTGDNPQSSFITEEFGSRTAFLVAQIKAVPEPGTLAVLAFGLLGLAAARRRAG